MNQSLRIRIALLLNFFVFAILLNTVGIVILHVIEDYGTSKVQASSLEGCKDLTIAAVSFFVASYVPRLGYRRSMIGGLLAVTLVNMLVATVHGFWVTPILYVVIGASFALIKIAVYSTVGLISKDQKEHTSFMNVLEGAFMIGALVGPQIFEVMTAHAHWTDTYWVLSLLTAIALVLMFLTDLAERPVESVAEQSNILEMFKIMRFPMVWTFVVCAFTYVMIEQSFQTWLPTFNKEVFSFSLAQATSFASIFAGSVALSRFVAGFLLRRMSWVVLMLIYLACAAALTIVVLLATRGPAPPAFEHLYQAPPLALSLSLIGFFLGPIYPTICSIVLSKLEKVHQSSMTGLLTLFSALGGTSGSLIIGTVSQHLSVHNAFIFPLVPITVLAIMLVVYKRLSDRFGVEHHTA